MDPETNPPPPESDYQPPDAGLPSRWMYRGALLALGVGTAVAAYLVISPPESESKQDQVRQAATPTPGTGPTATPTQPGSGQVRTPTPTIAITPTPGASPTRTSTGGGRTYTIRAGDTLSAIAGAFNTTVDAIVAANPGLTPEALQINQEIKIP
jgi:LysM repeat protein